MLEDAGRKFILDFDGGGVKKRKNQVKIQKEIAKKNSRWHSISRSNISRRKNVYYRFLQIMVTFFWGLVVSAQLYIGLLHITITKIRI